MSERDSQHVKEIPEATATGVVAALYADIRRVLGVPLVALVFRVLACEPARLEAIWADLGPNLGSDVVARAASRVVDKRPARGAVRRGAHRLNLDSAVAVATLRLAPDNPSSISAMICSIAAFWSAALASSSVRLQVTMSVRRLK